MLDRALQSLRSERLLQDVDMLRPVPDCLRLRIAGHDQCRDLGADILGRAQQVGIA